jgi:hypothetical protein
MDFPYIFTSRDMSRRGKSRRYRCRVLATMRNTALVEFADRRQLIVGKNALRKSR